MDVSVGIALAFVAMLCWGIGDFLIQRSTRQIGNWKTFFVITFFGTVVLAPFSYQKIPELLAGQLDNLYILISAGLILLVASILMFEGFKRGKLSVLEPIMSIEIPAAAFLAFFFLNDQISLTQTFLIGFLIVGLCLVSLQTKVISKKFFLEKGIIFFSSGAILMGVADFLLGWGSRLTDPIIASFVLNLVMCVVSGLVLLAQGEIKSTIRDISENRGLLLITSITDNVAWLAYAFAMSLVPIAVATGLSESSIIIAVILGFVINKEKLQFHQKVGLSVALVSAIILASVTV